MIKITGIPAPRVLAKMPAGIASAYWEGERPRKSESDNTPKKSIAQYTKIIGRFSRHLSEDSSCDDEQSESHEDCG